MLEDLLGTPTTLVLLVAGLLITWRARVGKYRKARPRLHPFHLPKLSVCVYVSFAPDLEADITRRGLYVHDGGGGERVRRTA